MDLVALVGIAGGLLGVAAILGGVIGSVVRSTKNEIIADQDKRIDQLKDQVTSCREEVAGLRGQVKTLKSDIISDIIGAVEGRLNKHE